MALSIYNSVYKFLHGASTDLGTYIPEILVSFLYTKEVVFLLTNCSLVRGSEETLLSSRNYQVIDSVPALDGRFLQPPPGRHYVRSFFFSRHINAPLAKVHPIARIILVFCLSGALLRTIDTAHADIVSASILWVMSLLVFLLSSMHAKIARLYFLLTLPTLLSLFATWALFNPVPGRAILIQQSVYPGFISIGLSAWQVVWVAIVAGYFWWKRRLFSGIIIATVVAFVLTRLFSLPAWTFTQVPFFHPLTILISDRTLLVAITKVIGYSGMILGTVALVVTSRDVELIGTLRQMRIPPPIIFFLSTVFRALDLALADYETIHQAQIARAINARPRSFIQRLRDVASMAVPMVAMMIRRSSEIGDALLARGYRLGYASADFYEAVPWRLIDWIVVALSLVVLYWAIGPHPDMTTLLQQWLRM